MIIKRLERIQLLESIFIFIVLYVVIIIPVSLLSDNAAITIYKTLALVLVIIAQDFIRKYVKNFFLFLILHLSLICICFLFGNGPFEKAGYIVFGVMSTIVSYRMHFASIKESFQIAFLVFSESLCVVCYLLARYFNIESLPSVIYTLSILFFVTFMLYYHGNNLAVTLGNISNTKNQPIKQILSFNNKVIVIFLLFMLIILLFSPYLHIDDLINLIGVLFVSILRFIFSGADQPESPAPYVEQNAPMAQDPMLDMLMQETKEPSIIMQVIEQIVMYAIYAALLVGFVLLIGFIIYSFYKRFYSSIKKSDLDETKEFVGLIDIFNENPLTNLIKKIIPSNFGSTNDQKIRRIFYNKVKKQIAKGAKIELSETANEISKKMNPAEHLTELTPLYEKARYSNIPCTKEDTALANSLLSKK